MKKTVLVFSLAASLVGLAPLAHADLNGFLASVHKQALSDIQKFNNHLSSQFGIPVPDVEAIVRSVPKPEDAFMILQLSQMSHRSPEVVLEKYQRNKGQGWGNLAKELGIKPGSREFHNLKRGNLSFTGERGDRDDERERGHGKGKGKDHDKGQGNSREKGRGKD